MRTLARVFLLTVLVLDVAFGAFFLMGSPLTIGAEPPDPTAADSGNEAEQKAVWDREALALLGQQLEARSRELERREAEYEELMRGAEVLRQAGLLPGETPTPEVDAAAARREAEANAAGEEAFQRLQQAYENMEAESAARALSELAGRDREAVVELLLGWRPRTSGAILDALTQVNPSLAADLSYEIWKRSGKADTAAAGNGR
jgi:flagellar motility protein MotE (MotC chaperone)